jgi:hypothetical protein
VLDLSTTISWVPWNPQREELAQRVADSRGLRIASVKLASAWFDTVTFGQVCDQDCWILSDASRKCAEARRIDGKPFPAIGSLGERKSHTPRGSNKSWPVGLLSTSFGERLLRKHYHNILLLEGGPDYLAACQLLVGRDPYTFLPVAMLGASQSIAADALPHFAGRETVIIAQHDQAGRDAGERWTKQIKGAGGSARLFNLRDGDLCDHVTAGATLNPHDLFQHERP